MRRQTRSVAALLVVGVLVGAPIVATVPAAAIAPTGALVGSAAGGAAAADGLGDGAKHEVAFSFTDERISESSGLVAPGGRMHTVNDSGDLPVVYTVDASTGDTLATTRYADQVSDVEAMAPGPGGSVWVGDIGDNSRLRASVIVFRVPVPDGSANGSATGAATEDRTVAADRFGLVYPDGSHDAEALLAHPVTGRLYVVSKGLFGGTVYAAPTTLTADARNPMTAVARVSGLVTGGAFFPDGEHVLLRGYATAAVYEFPGFRRVAGFALPSQEQGEAVAVGGAGAIYLSSEGVGSEVLELTLPAPLGRVVDGRGGAGAGGTPKAAPDNGPDSETDTGSDAGSSTEPEPTTGPFGPALGLALAALGLCVVAGLTLFAVRRHRP